MDKTINNSKGNKSFSFLEFFTKYDSLVIFGGFGIAILLAVVFTGIFQAGPIVRDNVVFNFAGALGLAALFVYLIFRFMGSNIIVFGRSFDIGLFVYIAIVLFIMFIWGN